MDIRKQVKKALDQRCKDLKDNQRRMINSCINRQKEQIVLDRIKITKNNQTYITTNPYSIKKETANYHKEAFRQRNSNFHALPPDWQQEYNPRSYIDKEWYNKTTDPITIEELSEVLQDLPNKKATGISGISYEMLKKLGLKEKSNLCTIFNKMLQEGLTPTKWKHSHIYPITKPKPWQCELTITRPIVLLESPRKCFTKILNNRITTDCKLHNILRVPTI